MGLSSFVEKMNCTGVAGVSFTHTMNPLCYRDVARDVDLSVARCLVCDESHDFVQLVMRTEATRLRRG